MLAAAGRRRNNESILSAGIKKQMKISSGYFRSVEAKKMIIKYESCTFVKRAGNIAVPARFTEAQCIFAPNRKMFLSSGLSAGKL